MPPIFYLKNYIFQFLLSSKNVITEKLFSRDSRLVPVQVFKAMYLNIPRNTFDCRESLMVSQVTLKKFIST